MAILIQPLEQKIIRQNPIYKESVIILESLNDDLSLDKELATAPDGYNVRQAFAYFVNKNLIKPKQWVELDLTIVENMDTLWKEALNKLKRSELYYGSSDL